MINLLNEIIDKVYCFQSELNLQNITINVKIQLVCYVTHSCLILFQTFLHIAIKSVPTTKKNLRKVDTFYFL